MSTIVASWSVKVILRDAGGGDVGETPTNGELERLIVDALTDPNGQLPAFPGPDAEVHAEAERTDR